MSDDRKKEKDLKSRIVDDNLEESFIEKEKLCTIEDYDRKLNELEENIKILKKIKRRKKKLQELKEEQDEILKKMSEKSKKKKK